MSDDRTIERDRMRFTRNTLSSNLVLLAILFNVFYFINIYKSDINHVVGNYYYQLRIGVSIIFNLIFMLAAFLSSEGIKNYKVSYAYALFVLGAMQIIRIFILPLNALKTEVTVAGQTGTVMGMGQFTLVTIYLVLSGICCFAAAVIGLKRSRELNEHLTSLGLSANA